jgi:hypothetical protein
LNYRQIIIKNIYLKLISCCRVVGLFPKSGVEMFGMTDLRRATPRFPSFFAGGPAGFGFINAWSAFGT